VFRLRGLAVAVHMRTDNAAAFIKHDALAVTGALRSAAKIGWYLEVSDDGEAPALVSDNAWIEQSQLYGRGTASVRPDLKACSPFLSLGTSAPVAPPRPSCPA
jgi:hypothetical protein